MLLDIRIVVDADELDYKEVIIKKIIRSLLDYRATDVFARYGTLQHITDLTHVNGNIPDLMLSHKLGQKDDRPVSAVTVQCLLLKPSPADLPCNIPTSLQDRQFTHHTDHCAT